MESTSLTTVMIAAAAMAGVVIASSSDGPNLHCDHGLTLGLAMTMDPFPCVDELVACFDNTTVPG